MKGGVRIMLFSRLAVFVVFFFGFGKSTTKTLKAINTLAIASHFTNPFLGLVPNSGLVSLATPL